MTTCHGVELQLPEGSDDHSVFRFLLPRSKVTSKPDMLAGRGATEPDFHPNLLVTRHKLAPDTSLQQLLAQACAQLQQQDPSFKILGEGEGAHGGRPLSWQDTSFSGPQSMQIYQRQIAVKVADDLVTMLTLTSNRKDLRQHSASVGMDLEER